MSTTMVIGSVIVIILAIAFMFYLAGRNLEDEENSNPELTKALEDEEKDKPEAG